MSVVNVKVKFIRPMYENLQEWMKCPDNVYIGRRGVVFIDKKRYPLDSSVFANPYKVGKHGTRDEVINKYEIYIHDRISKEPETMKELLNLEGKILGCWCSPEPCHGNVLLRLIKELKND